MKKISNIKNNQNGAALPLALLSLLFLTLLGFMAMTTASIEVRLSANERDDQQAVYAAEAAVAHMRARLKQRLIDNGRLIDWGFVLLGPEACNPTLAADNLAARGIRSNIVGFDYDVCVYDDLDENIGSCSTQIVEIVNPADVSLFKESNFAHAVEVDPPGPAEPTYDPNKKIYVCAAAINRTTGTRSALEVLVEPGGILMAATDSKSQLGGGMYKSFSGDDQEAVDPTTLKDIGSL